MASDYLNSARVLVSAQDFAAAPIILLAWQAIENSFKALAVGHGIPETHDIGEIMTHLLRNGVVTQSELDSIKTYVLWVTGSRTYNATRYPENAPTYWHRFGTWNGPRRPRRALLIAVSGASHIHEFVKQKMGL